LSFLLKPLPVRKSREQIQLQYSSNNVVLHCEVQFGSSVDFVYWQHDCLSLTVENARYSDGTIDSPSLTIHNVIYDDTEYYTCNVVNQSGTGTSLFINLAVVDDVVGKFV
jgi:hypothetical protein